MIKVINDLEKLHIENRTAIAIGKFDGVHIGHRVLIDEIVKAHAKGLLSVVFTFNPAPEVFFGFQSDEQLMTAEEKRNVQRQKEAGNGSDRKTHPHSGGCACQ